MGRRDDESLLAGTRLSSRSHPCACAQAGESREGIGIVTPYAAQVSLIQDRLAHSLDGYLSGSGEGPEIEVKSVDGYQGREKDIIVFSAVRANMRGAVGFLDDWRRLNVALTRARRGLVLLGNEPTLSQDANWAAFIALLHHWRCVMQR